METIEINESLSVRIYDGPPPTVWIDAKDRVMSVSEFCGGSDVMGLQINPQEIDPLRAALAEAAKIARRRMRENNKGVKTNA